MKNTNNPYDIFTKMYPHLDIHGETVATSDLVIKSFIQDNIKLGNEYIVIIHGIGGGLLKKKTHEILKSHKSVIEFNLDFYNPGSTVIKLNIDKM